MNPAIDTYIENTKHWTNELKLLRSIILECGLTEELKWKQPCYTYTGKNVLILSEFKNHCVISFIKGVLLQDEKNLLHSPGENSQSVKFFKFTSTKEIQELEDLIKAYIFEAIEVEKAGLKSPKIKSSNIEYPEELVEKFKDSPAFESSFKALTPGRQRGYIIHINGAKQSSTRTSRIEKNVKRILDGYGFNDCTCGLSKRMPNCDGSHKSLIN